MSPVAAPSTLGETLAERLARKAAEAKAREEYAKGDPMATNPDAPPEGPALAAVSGQASPGNRGLADLGRQSTGTGSFRSGYAMGSNGDSTPEVLATPEVIAEQQKQDAAKAAMVPGDANAGTAPASPLYVQAPPKPAPVDVEDNLAQQQAAAAELNKTGGNRLANGVSLGSKLHPITMEQAAAGQRAGRTYTMNRPEGASPEDDVVPPTSASLSQQIRDRQRNSPIEAQLNPVATMGQPAPATDPTQGGTMPEKPLTAYEQAKAQQKPLGVKGGIALAMSIAADAFAGMAGRQGGYTAAMLGQRRQDLADATNRIQGEIDRLQAEQDKAYNKKRQEQLDKLHEAEVNAQIENNKLQRAQQYEKWQQDYKLATDEHERKVLKDKMDGMAKQSQAELRKATIEKLQRDGRVLAPGETYSVWDPVSQSRVVIDRNDQQVVTTTQNNETQSAIGPDGKPVSVNKSSTNTVVKGTQSGPATNGASAPALSEGDKARGVQLKALWNGGEGKDLHEWSLNDLRILRAMGEIK